MSARTLRSAAPGNSPRLISGNAIRTPAPRCDSRSPARPPGRRQHVAFEGGDDGLARRLERFDEVTLFGRGGGITPKPRMSARR